MSNPKTCNDPKVIARLLRSIGTVPSTMHAETFNAAADLLDPPAQLRLSAGSEAVDPVRGAFRNADAQDWEHLSSLLGYGGHGKFWRHVFEEVREHLLHIQPQTSQLTDGH